MRVDRSKLIAHLEKITCQGQVSEAVFSGAFQVTALTEDHQLLVVAPALERTEPLPESIGIADLPKFIRALGVISGAGNEAAEVDVRFEDNRLVLDEDHRGVLRLMTASPRTISTVIEPQTAEALLAKAPTGPGIALTRALLEGIRATFSLFKAAEVELFVGPDGGKIRVGNENSDVAEFASGALKADQEYSLLFGRHFVDVMSVLTNYAEAELRLGGPGELVAVHDGPYVYLLSPRARSADA